ncbi:hypothetical protein ACRAWF_47140 [Streptomyces sp. L7]
MPGRNRGLPFDVLGLAIAVVVAAASAHEDAVGIALLDKVAADTDAVEKALVDQGFKNTAAAHGRKVNIEVEVVERNPTRTGFVPQATRWVVERACGILTLHRRLVRELRTPAPQFGVAGVLGDDLGDTSPVDRGARVAHRMTGRSQRSGRCWRGWRSGNERSPCRPRRRGGRIAQQTATAR